jgi:hypothetical protein
MAEPLPSNPELSQMANRIVELHREVDELLRATRYKMAARRRDEREALEKKLAGCGSSTLLHNIELVKFPERAATVLTEMLESKSADVDERLLERLADAPLPVRWILQTVSQPPVGTLRRRLSVDSLLSPHFQAKFPVLSPESFRDARDIHAWVDTLAHETALAKVPVIWVCTDLPWLAPTSVFERWRELFQHRDFEFVACVHDLETPLVRQIARFNSVTVIEV